MINICHKIYFEEKLFIIIFLCFKMKFKKGQILFCLFLYKSLLSFQEQVVQIVAIIIFFIYNELITGITDKDFSNIKIIHFQI